MKFTNAILSLATIGTINSLNNNNNNNHHVVVDAKSWSLRGLIGRSTNTNNNNNNDVTRSLLKDVEGEDSSRGENLPTPTANLEDLSINQQQGGGRRLKKKDKKDKGDGGKKGQKGAEAATAEEVDEGEKKKKEPKKGKKDEKIGKAVFEGAPEDTQAQHAACDDTTEEGGEVGRRILSSKGNKDKALMESGMCNECSKEEGDAEEVEASGLSVVVETSDDQTCDPDDTTSCEEDSGAGEDPTLALPEEATEDVNEEEAVARRELMERRLTGDTRNIGQFAPLTCNPVEFDCTAAAGLSTVVGEGEVVVPCGTCLVYDLGAEATIAGLNIIGKLLVPTNYKSTLTTPHVFVQGELEMSDNNPISEDNTSMKIVLTGSTDVMFTPHEPVAGAAPLNAGVKPFLVAGGKLNIHAWNEGEGVAWTPLLSMAEADRVYVDPISSPPEDATKALTPPPRKSDPSISCPSLIVDDFTNGYDPEIWSGGAGGILTFDETTGVLTETNLQTNWQGFRHDFTKFILDCPLIAGATYLVTIRLKIDDPNLAEGALTSCAQGLGSCPRIGRQLITPTSNSHSHRPISPPVIGRNKEWFTVATTWTWTQAELDTSTGMVFYLDQFTGGNVIHMEQFQFELPSSKSYPPEDDPCLELVVNGDAEDADGRGWHHYPMWTHDHNKYTPVIKEETLEDGSTNKYWHVGNRNWIGDSLRFNINPACLVLNYKYTLSLRVRFSGTSSHSTRYWFEIKGQTEGGFKYNKPLYCPTQSPADGWVTCSGDFEVTSNYVFTSTPEIIFVTQDEQNVVQPSQYHDWDYDDVSIRFKGGPAEGLEVDSAAANRWGVHSDLHITSSTLHGRDSQNARVVEVIPKDGNVVLKLDTGIKSVLTEKDTPGQGVEIAVTTRNIKIVGDDDGTDNGGYLQVFHTPGVAQQIEGVEFLNMGQLGRKNRFSMQLLYNGNVEGTSLSRNSFRQSNMRCISVDGTANATIVGNVGAEISGHCYYFSHESADNMVVGNLASNMDNRVNWNNRINGYDDYDADGFAIWSPANHFIGNVAAGGHKRGFRFYLDWRTRGEDLVQVGGSLRRSPIGTFKDNKAHSNFRQGFHLADFEQFFQFRDVDNVPVFENLSAYRNREQGIYAWNLINAKFIGGFLSDNQKGIEIRRMDGITVEDFVIKGQTEIFKNHIESSDKLCAHSSWTYEGLHMMGTAWRLGDQDPKWGLRLKNVAFSGFDKEKEYYPNCPSTEPIGISTDTHYAAHFDYKTSFSNVTVADKRGMILDGCRADGYGYPDIAINDLDGSLDPDQTAASGVLVSDKDYMKGLFGGESCKSTAGCMAYCTGLCLRLYTVFTEGFGTENFKLRVTDTTTGLSVEIPGNARSYNERWDTYAYDGHQRSFAAYLPAGSYTAEFVDENGNSVWPTYAEEQWAQSPDCANGVSIGEITLIKPEIDAAIECADLIRNGLSANRDGTLPWLHTHWYGDKALELKPGEGRDGGNAIATYDRRYHWTGPAQNLNTLCTAATEGEFFEFSAWMKMTDFDGNPAANIDPNREWWRNQSPQLTMTDRRYRDASTKEYLYNGELRDLAAVVRPYNKDEWSLIHGIFKMPPTSARMWLEIERAPDRVNYLLDSVTLNPFTCDRDSLVSNGRLDTNDTRFWDTWGGDVVLDVVPGPGGGNALKSSGRPYHSHTQAQIMNFNCVGAGERVAFSAKIKVGGDGLQDCNIYTWNQHDGGNYFSPPLGWAPCPDMSAGCTRCPDIMLHTYKPGKWEYHRVAAIISDTPDEEGWHHAHGIHVLNSNQEMADLTKMYFGDPNPKYEVMTADVEAYVLEQNCQALILNPDMEGKDMFWSYTDRDRSKIKVIPGEGGSGHALRVYDRDHSWRGLKQLLDARCFVAGEVYAITANFRLTDSSLNGVACDPNYQWNNNEGSQCPSVVVHGSDCEGGNVYWQFWNGKSDKTWDSEGWNSYEASFEVNDQLASCSKVEVYIHQINKNWNLEVDYVQISEWTTQSPTITPTESPTILVTNDSTLSPTEEPTAMPTLSTALTCPPVGQYLELSAGPVMLERSSTLCIITKADVDSNGIQSEVAPVARSSNNGDWEKHAGDFAEGLLYGQEFGDYPAGCQITLPPLGPGQKYFIASYVESSRRLNAVEEEKKAVARLLEQATFGTTLTELNEWNKGPVSNETVAEWIREQMALPVTSHREYFRRRANPRLTTPVRIGRNNHPCSANARWRKFTFSRKEGDRSQFSTFMAVYDEETDFDITITLNGFIYTTVKSIAFEDKSKTLEFNKEYNMCGLPEEKSELFGGRIWLRLEDGSCTHLKNPLVAFDASSTQPARVLNLLNISGSLQVIDEKLTQGEEIINTLPLTDELCNTLSDITEEGDEPIHGLLPDGSYVMFDPRLELQENTIENPLSDGGGMTTTLTGGKTKCANVPRTFLNEDSCVLSYSPTACSSNTAPDLGIELNAENLQVLHELTGQYIYAILGLPVQDILEEKLESPCTPGLRSRWEIKPAGECTATTLGANTNSSLFELLAESSDPNPHIRDIVFPSSGYSCDSADEPITEVEIIIGSQCFKRVHQDHMSVFDFSFWTLDHTHPGNMVAMMEGESNPIKKWRDEQASAFLIFPSYPGSESDVPAHPLERWSTNAEKFPMLGRFGDVALFVDLPNEVRTDEVAEHFGEASAETGSGVVTCGSPNEVANDPTHGKYYIPVHEKGTDWGLEDQKRDVWFQISLFSKDQLAQRVAFALSQILVVVEASTSVRDHTEPYVAYNDILVRNAFGNYRDILKEVSYNPFMAEHLTYMQSKSTAHMWEHQHKHTFADENYAREIMQLFTTGLYMLDKDGTRKLDENGDPIHAYSNDEIMSLSRVWTGFDYQQGRGNVEENTWSGNRIDPMRIEPSWRDKFPKSDMTGGYIGDSYPLCVDLPDKMYLRKGATYRLMGSKHMPELMYDDPGFKNDATMKKFVLEANSALKEALCNPDASGACQYPITVTLSSNLSCTGKECDADTARVVDAGNGIHYEYVSPPCVEQAFYSGAKKIVYKDRMRDSSCANPRLPYASEACCSTADVAAYRWPDYVYDQERVKYSTAESRCDAFEGKAMCDFNYINDLDYHKKGYHWTTDSCKIQVKVNAVGQVALVYKPNSFNDLHPHIDAENRNFFKVYWEGEYPKNDIDGPNGNNCGYGACTSLETGGCLCDTTVRESRVFSAMPTSPEEVLSMLSIGAYDTAAYDEGTYKAPLTENGVTAYQKAGEEFTPDTVFEVMDKNRRLFRLKNSIENVRISGNSTYTFRNAPSFMSVLNTESTAGKAADETDAALDHYFYHDNTAPFIAYRLIQRMVTSNPSPKYVKLAADAFTSGVHAGIGSGKYGDLAATVAAILLAPQARDTAMDSDPYDGHYVEPVLQITRLSRGMEIETTEKAKQIYFDHLEDKIGQTPYLYDSVFSFFLPEYKPDGTTKVGQATLVAPEATALDAPKTIGLMNGMFSMVKYGLNNCRGGFNDWWGSCHENNDFTYSYARLGHEDPWVQPETAATHAKVVVDEIALILTAGRLSPTSTEIIANAYSTKLIAEGHEAALRLALQLVVTTPEFHTNQIAIPSGQARPEPALPTASGVPYKAVVMVLHAGGADSFNMLVPHTCTDAKDMYQEYKDVRLEVALAKGDLIPLNDVSNQICEKFGVHPRFSKVAEMFNAAELSWFVNTGQLDQETDKYNYWKDTKTQLFAHNHMQQAAQRVDPYMEALGTGVLGRMRDSAKMQGRNVGAFSIDWSASATSGKPGINTSPIILSRSGVRKFNEDPSTEDMTLTIKELNQDVTKESGAFSDGWADHMTMAMAENERMYNTLSTKTTATTFPNEHLAQQLKTIAMMIDSRTERAVDGDVFFASKGGFDTHMETLMHTNNRFAELDAAYGAFRAELKAKGVWDQVVLVTVSDFARTLNPNGQKGVDHAWGGHYMMMGGGVKGGQIHGVYPDNLTDDGDVMLTRGRAVPSMGWEKMFKPMAEWFGCPAEDMPEILPNMDNFPRAEYWSDHSDVFKP